MSSGDGPDTGTEHRSNGAGHCISIRSIQEWRGEFDAEALDEAGDLSETAEWLQLHDEISLSFKCSCGDRFRKFETATDHLRSLQQEADQ